MAAAASQADQQNRALELLKELAWNATSFQVLEPDFCYWFHERGFVAYVDTGSAWVAAGAPFSLDEDLATLTIQFVHEAQRRRRRTVFFGVEERFVRATGYRAVDAGLQPWWNPQRWSEVLRSHRRLREQLRRARAKGVVVQRVDPPLLDSTIRAEIERVTELWLQSRPMPPMAFLVDVHPFTCSSERRYYVARREGRCVGYLASVPIYRRHGWFFEDLIRDPESPNGTSEALIDAAMRDVAEDGCEFATLGLAPLAGEKRWMQRVRRISASLYNFEGVQAFKARLHPDGWDRILIATPPHGSSAIAIYDVLSAFAHGRPLRFGFATLLRPSKFVLRVMTGVLAVWTLMMTFAPGVRWFPSRLVHVAWIVFDVALLLLFGGILGTKKRWFLLGACGMLALDSILTTAQFFSFNAGRLSSVSDWTVAALALAGPPLAFTILARGLSWLASRRKKNEPA